MQDFNIPAIVGGAPLLDQPTAWPPRSPAAAGYALGVVNSGRLGGSGGSDAPWRTELERRGAAERGYAFAIACTNGTDAIALALMAELTIKGQYWANGRKKVLVPDLIPAATLSAVRRAVFELVGHKPEFVFFDSREDDWTIDEQAVVAYLGARADEVLASVVASSADTWARLESLVVAHREANVPLIHDGAHCGGAIYENARPDSDTESLDVRTWYGIATGEGGLYYTNDPHKAKVARFLTDEGNPPVGPLDPAPGVSLGGLELPLATNLRLSGVLGATALGARDDMPGLVPVVRVVRQALGTELRAPDGMVVFRTPAIQAPWAAWPRAGVTMELTAEALERYGLGPEHWVEVFSSEGFASDAYPFGIERAPLPAHLHPQARRLVSGSGARFPRTKTIRRAGLVVHVGNLIPHETEDGGFEAASLTAARFEQTIARVDPSASAVRAHFGLPA